MYTLFVDTQTLKRYLQLSPDPFNACLTHSKHAFRTRDTFHTHSIFEDCVRQTQCGNDRAERAADSAWNSPQSMPQSTDADAPERASAPYLKGTETFSGTWENAGARVFSTCHTPLGTHR